MNITKKPDGWIVYDENGMHRFDTEEEAKKHLGAAPVVEEEESEEEEQMVARRRRKTSTKRKSIPTNKALYSRVKAAAKRKFAVYPSAYANAWLVREYKKRGGKQRCG